VKTETRSFYEDAVSRTVSRVASQLDDALDLARLARGAALSPFHFHRVFRGMVGETPLELHRRLRMERAAWRILQGDAGITAVAFDAGYETHEAFTRAFRHFYGVPPSSFRPHASREGKDGALPRSFELAARCGVHFNPPGSAEPNVHFMSGGQPMNVEIKEMPELRVATVRHIGPYPRISEAFGKLGAIAGPAGLYAYPEAAMIAVYYDDPDTTLPEELRSDAGISVPERQALPDGLGEARIRAGRYACMTHRGSYKKLGDAWSRLMGEWLPRSGERVGEGVSFEVYRNHPGNAEEAELKTELFVPLA